MHNILCFGDSNTYGYNSENGGRFEYAERWTGRLQKLLGEDYLVVEEGLGGRTTVFDDPFSEGRNGLKDIDSALEKHSPLDLVIVMLGTNDTKTNYCASATAIAFGASKIVERVKTHVYRPDFASPKVLLISPPVIKKGVRLDGCPVFDDTSHEKSLRFAPLYKAEAERLNAYYLDSATVAEAGDDKVHFSREGHEKLALAIRDKVLEILS